MGDLSVKLDLSELQQLGGDLKRFEDRLNQEVEKLAVQTHAHIVEQVQTRLHTRRAKYVENLDIQQVGASTWVIMLKEPAVWIEEGMEAHSMVDDLLRQSPHNPNSKPAKTAKDGSRYRIIPLEHSKGPTQQTPAQASLTETIRQKLRELKIPYMKIERDDKGRPLSGMLHKFNIEDQPAKPADHQPGPPKRLKDMPDITVQNQHGFGQGPAGQVMQGSTGIPFLRGVRIYQRPLFNPDGSPQLGRNGLQKAQRGIMTFRVVSSKHKGAKWNHPGIEGMHFLDEAADWAASEWDQKIVPELLRSLDGRPAGA